MSLTQWTWRRLAGATLLAAAFAVPMACRHTGGAHHALGDARIPNFSASTAGQCCGGKKGSESPQHGGHDHGQPQQPAAKAEFKGDPYLLDTDPVSGAKLGPADKQVILEHEGRELRFATEQNAASFRADVTKYLAKVDAALIKQQLPHYALQTCPVSDKKLGDMGEPVNFLHKNRLVRFCCPDCRASFLKDPGKFVAKLDAAVIAAQSKKYVAKTCVVSDEPLGEMGDPVDYVIGGRLVRLCCEGCIKKLRKDPLKYLEQLGQPESPGAGKHGDHK